MNLNNKNYAMSFYLMDDDDDGYLKINKKSISIMTVNKRKIANFSTYTILGYSVIDDDGKFSHPDNPLFGGYNSHDELYNDIMRLMRLLTFMREYYKNVEIKELSILWR